MAAVSATDPQGTETLENLVTDGISVSMGGGAIATYAMVCNDDGDCTGSFNQNLDGISCANATAYTLTFTAMDEDGNTSAGYDVTGRQASSAEG